MGFKWRGKGAWGTMHLFAKLPNIRKNSLRCLGKSSQLPKPPLPGVIICTLYADRCTESDAWSSGIQVLYVLVSGIDNPKFPDGLVVKFWQSFSKNIYEASPIHLLLLKVCSNTCPHEVKKFCIYQCLKYLDEKHLLCLLFICGSILMSICWFAVRPTNVENVAQFPWI